MDIQKIVQSLHPLEKKVIPFLQENADFNNLVSRSKLKDIEVMRALQWLQNKDALRIKTDIKEVAVLDENGLKYAKKGLPEMNMLRILSSSEISVDDAKKKAGISDDELNICIGSLKSKAAVNISKKDNKLMISITDQGKKLLSKPSLEELFLEKNFPADISKLTPEERFAFDSLKKRKKIIKVELNKIKTISLTNIGKDIIKHKISEKDSKIIIEKITPEIIKNGSWKGKDFRPYDIKINVPEISGGKRHFVKQAIEYAKNIWTELGFKEMEGPLLNTSFWNFDALFTAQDHPVRDLQDTFFIKNPSKGNLPDKKIVAQVKKAHEEGVSGSKGWEYLWNPDESKKNVMRTHTTVLSAKTIADLKEKDLPAKFFAVGRCFRNETVDWKHLFEFNQTEGIVIDPNANFRHLLGYLKEFFRKMGYEKARFRPAHFPYTEPSVEIDVFHPVHKQWVELGGAGMFRPEVVVPLLGKDIPVLAWGPGLDRMIMEFYKIKDLRDLYKNDIKQLKELKFWLRS